MGRRFHHLHDDERGFAVVFVGVSMMAFLAATTLAIDVGMFMTARNQAQNSADAGALAGAVALVYNSYTDRSSSGPAVQSALLTARANSVIREDVSIEPDDVTFPTDSGGNANRVRVQVFRSAARGNPLGTLLGVYFGVPTADVGATATAEAAPANAATCVKPWAVPDKWIEKQTPEWDESDQFDLCIKQGGGPNSPPCSAASSKPHPNPDIYVPITESTYTGFRGHRDGPDYGRRIVLKVGNPANAISASHFYAISLAGGVGADWYRENIQGCWPDVMAIGDSVPVQTGNMVGPTRQGVEELISRDPNAYWNSATDTVVSDVHPSPRVIVIPAFNPHDYEMGRTHGNQNLKVANLLAFFIEDMQGNDVVGRMVPMTGLIRGTPIPNAYLRAIRLVE